MHFKMAICGPILAVMSCGILPSVIIPPVWTDVSIIALDEWGRKVNFHLLSVKDVSGGPILKWKQTSPGEAHVVVKYSSTLDIDAAFEGVGISHWTERVKVLGVDDAQVVLLPMTRRAHLSLQSNWRRQSFVVEGSSCASGETHWMTVWAQNIGFGRQERVVQVLDGVFSLRSLRDGRYVFLGFCDGRLIGSKQIDLSGIELSQGTPIRLSMRQ